MSPPKASMKIHYITELGEQKEHWIQVPDDVLYLCCVTVRIESEGTAQNFIANFAYDIRTDEIR